MSTGEHDPPPTNGTAWRLRSIEARLKTYDDMRLDALAERVSYHSTEILDLTREIASLRRALYTFALSITSAAIIFGISVLELVK